MLNKSIFMAGAVSCFLLGACDVSKPTQLNVKKVRLHEQTHVLSMDVHDIGNTDLEPIVKKYKRYGEGPIKVLVAHKPGSANAAHSQEHADHVKKKLAKLGVTNVDATVIPMDMKQYWGQAVITYELLEALAPEGCSEHMPGEMGAESDIDGYPIGCKTETIFSKMISRPSDLRGNDGMKEKSGARRQGTVVEGAMSGTPNEPLDGMNASDIGGE